MLPKLITLFILLIVCWFNVNSQQIAYIEYFFDTDYGKGDFISLTQADSVEFIAIIPTSELSEGFHTVYTRFIDTDGNKSLYEGRPVYIQPEIEAIPSPPIITAEYFYDIDPGIGSGNPIIVTPSDSVDILTSLPTGSLSEGFHKPFIRMMDSTGVWSLYEGRPIYIQDEIKAPPIIATEYFWGVDPGTGNGIPIIVTSSDSIDIQVNLPTGSLSEGFHKPYLRMMDSTEVWSLYEGRPVYIQPASAIYPSPPIVAAEYFMDADPGIGNGVPVDIPVGDTLDLIVDVTLTNIDTGIHNLYFRFADSLGVWSLSMMDTVHIFPGLVLKVFLEGPFNGINMNTDLNPNYLPLSQPYSASPWNYFGNEQLDNLPDSDIVDWVLLELRETSGGPHTATHDSVIFRQAVLLKNDGEVIDTEGNNVLLINTQVYNNLHAVVWHRNHLGIMSALPLAEANEAFTYDFTDQISKAYLNGQKEIYPGAYGMMGGDIDGNGLIEIEDKTLWSVKAGQREYQAEDLNMDGQTDNTDKNNIWIVNVDENSEIPDTILFICGTSSIADIDGNIYNTVMMGSQCWMKENLNIGTIINSSSSQTDNGTIEKYCYGNSTSNCDTYGGLYQWDEMMQYVTTEGTQGICPPGWHLPTDAEWCTLENYVDVGEISCTEIGWRGTDAGGNLKETGITHWYPPNTDATNSSSFTGLPGAYRLPSGSFNELRYYAYFWSSSEHGSNAWNRRLAYDDAKVSRGNASKDYGFSVRCLKD